MDTWTLSSAPKLPYTKPQPPTKRYVDCVVHLNFWEQLDPCTAGPKKNKGFSKQQNVVKISRISLMSARECDFRWLSCPEHVIKKTQT